MYSFLEISGLVYLVSVGYAMWCDLAVFVENENKKAEYRKLQKYS